MIPDQSGALLFKVCQVLVGLFLLMCWFGCEDAPVLGSLALVILVLSSFNLKLLHEEPLSYDSSFFGRA
jgi:hypothetical protein